MSVEFFKHFLRTEIQRNPSLGSALQLKSNLRRCSQQFERAVADLHYRLIKSAVKLLFSRISSARLQELSSSAASSSCETKCVITDSSQKGSTDSCSSCRATGNEQCSSRWGAQSNNLQGLRAAPRSGRQASGGGGGGGENEVEVGGRGRRHRGNETKQEQLYRQQQPQQGRAQFQQQPQQQNQCQQPQQPQQCRPQLQQHPQQHPCQQPQQQSCGARPACDTQRQPPPPRHQPPMREGPTCSYPDAGHHNKQALSGWYVANMDALLSNLMRLFELIYRDTLRMCGLGASDMSQMRNALPDPTLLSMQQRASGAWRPNFMNCKIDFLLHMAAMVYRNTQDLRCGCQCNMLVNPCGPPTTTGGDDAGKSELPPGSRNRWAPRPGGGNPGDNCDSRSRRVRRATTTANYDNAAAASASSAPAAADVEDDEEEEVADRDSDSDSSRTSLLIIAPGAAEAAALRRRQPDGNSNSANTRSGRAAAVEHARRTVGRTCAVVASASSPSTDSRPRRRSSRRRHRAGDGCSSGDSDMTGMTCMSVDIQVSQ